MSRPNPLDDLGSSARSLLEACAVLGESFTFPQLFSILGDPMENGTARFHLLLGWRELSEEGLLGAEDPTRPERFHFTNPELREDVLESLMPEERRRLEARISDSVVS